MLNYHRLLASRLPQKQQEQKQVNIPAPWSIWDSFLPTSQKVSPRCYVLLCIHNGWSNLMKVNLIKVPLNPMKLLIHRVLPWFLGSGSEAHADARRLRCYPAIRTSSTCCRSALNRFASLQNMEISPRKSGAFQTVGMGQFTHFYHIFTGGIIHKSQLSQGTIRILFGAHSIAVEISRCLLDSRADPDSDLVTAASSAWKKQHGVMGAEWRKLTSSNPH